MNYFNDMFPDELDAVVSNPGEHGFGAAAILPVGSVEQHGTHLLLGCDGYIASAMGHMVACKLDNSVLFPMLPFSWIGGLRPFAGTIDMRAFLTGEYMEQVATEIIRQGFERLAIINCHGGGLEMVFSVSRKVFMKTGKPILSMYSSFISDNWPEIQDIYTAYGMEASGSATEAARLIGALYYFGKHSLSDRVLQNNKNAIKEFGEFRFRGHPPGFNAAFRLANIGHDYLHESQHAAARKVVNRDAGIKSLDFVADKIAWGIINAE